MLELHSAYFCMIVLPGWQQATGRKNTRNVYTKFCQMKADFFMLVNPSAGLLWLSLNCEDAYERLCIDVLPVCFRTTSTSYFY